MKPEFEGWYPKSPTELAALWDNALFVPDANILLHCVRLPATARETLLQYLERMRDVLWIPYQVGLEFHRNRLGVEDAALGAYDKLIKDYEDKFESLGNQLGLYKNHPVIRVADELEALEAFKAAFAARMNSSRSSHPSEAIANAVARLTAIFDSRVGSMVPEKELASIRKDGEERFSRGIPPGYRDKKKEASGADPYGDLIIWREMIKKAKADKKSIVFVSDDAKDDWWWKHQGRKLGPRPELVEEFRRESGEGFYIYDLASFLRQVAKRHTELSADRIADVEAGIKEEEAVRQRLSSAKEAERRALASLEAQRDNLASQLAGLPGTDLGNESSRSRAEMIEAIKALDADIAVARAGLSVEELHKPR